MDGQAFFVVVVLFVCFCHYNHMNLILSCATYEPWLVFLSYLTEQLPFSELSFIMVNTIEPDPYLSKTPLRTVRFIRYSFQEDASPGASDTLT